MSKESDEKSALVPRLRFPQFRGGWGLVMVGEFFDLTDKPEKTTTFDKDKVLTVKLHAKGIVKNEKTTLTGGANYFNRRAGQFVFSKIDLLNGAFGVVPDTLDGFASSSDVPAYSFNAKQSSTFFVNWLKLNYERLEIERTGTSSTLKRVSPERFLTLAVPAPTIAEQQKIANCLSSLDELITAETQKVDALKTHKKGLMQQLFPRESETVPRLRFPEFWEAPEWGKATLQELVTTVSPPSKIQSSSYLLQGKFPIIDQSQEAICGWTNDESSVISEGLPLVVFGDHTCALKFVDVPFAQGADGIKILKAKPVISAEYLFHSLNCRPLVMEDYKRHFSILKERVVFYPDIESGEQQKVADCLSSLEDLITAQSQKIDALKTHKKGLMQQLFPVQEEVQA